MTGLMLFFILPDVVNKHVLNRNFRLAFVTGLVIFAISFVSKILHWKDADQLIMLSHVTLFFTYAAQFIVRPNKTIREFLRTISALALIISSVFILFHWPFASELRIVTLFSFGIYFLLTYILKRQKNGKTIPPGNENNR